MAQALALKARKVTDNGILWRVQEVGTGNWWTVTRAVLRPQITTRSGWPIHPASPLGRKVLAAIRAANR